VEYWREYYSEKVGILVEDIEEYRELSYIRLVNVGNIGVHAIVWRCSRANVDTM
jgi:hypothetical protein